MQNRILTTPESGKMVVEENYRQCTLSVMDTIVDPDIHFDEKGICHYYRAYRKAAARQTIRGQAGVAFAERMVEKIRQEGKGKPYDCIMGLSGGVDSSYVAYQAKKYGLRPLAVHFDNGWNSELAVKNIENIVNKCGFDLYTLVVDWEEFRDLQLAYLKSSVVDIEVPTDHAIGAIVLKLALKHKVKYILSGSNLNTEFVMPKTWIFNKGDHVNLNAIHRQFGTQKLKTYPLNDTLLKKRALWAGIEQVSLLNYLDYNKKQAKATITNELSWRDYGGKHYESLFTKFYQAHILPVKFRIDKRKPHLSTLIFSGQLSREEAIQELQQHLYTKQDFQQEKEFFMKKLELTEGEWQNLMSNPPRSHYDFATERPLDQQYKWIKPFKKAYRYFYPVKS